MMHQGEPERRTSCRCRLTTASGWPCELSKTAAVRHGGADSVAVALTAVVVVVVGPNEDEVLVPTVGVEFVPTTVGTTVAVSEGVAAKSQRTLDAGAASTTSPSNWSLLAWVATA